MNFISSPIPRPFIKIPYLTISAGSRVEQYQEVIFTDLIISKFCKGLLNSSYLLDYKLKSFAHKLFLHIQLNFDHCIKLYFVTTVWQIFIQKYLIFSIRNDLPFHSLLG